MYRLRGIGAVVRPLRFDEPGRETGLGAGSEGADTAGLA
jgi:hypothetical protein